MLLEKVKSEILWDIVPAYSKKITAIQDEQTLYEVTRTFVKLLAKVVFPEKQLELKSLYLY